ncbi:MAG: MBL fold metallo-hydrolase [Propylenella sp.]
MTWIGHATALIRMGDRWVLTDPAMTRSVGPAPFRVSRLAPARPSIEELPPIDAILISHGDHDHLDWPTLRRLARRNPDATVFVPLRNAPLVEAAGFRDVRELDWYERDRLGDLEIVAVPAKHGLRRPLLQLNAMLWGGYVLRHRGSALYFAGDTGFDTFFQDMRRRVGPVDVALVPIGAYEPRDLQKDFHTTPEEAAEIGRTLGARIAIGVHWGTFPLSADAPVEQKSRFLAATGRGVSTRTLRVGETLVLR